MYSLSGCDLTPSFFGVGKLKIFDLYISNTLTEEDLKVFKDLSSGPETMTDEHFRACSNSRGHFQFAHFHCHLAFLEYFCYYLHYGSVILTHD